MACLRHQVKLLLDGVNHPCFLVRAKILLKNPLLAHDDLVVRQSGPRAGATRLAACPSALGACSHCLGCVGRGRHIDALSMTIDATPTLVPGTGAVAGTAWQDLNENGVREAGEPPLSGVQVTLSQSGLPLLGVITGADGSVPLHCAYLGTVSAQRDRAGWVSVNHTRPAVDLYHPGCDTDGEFRSRIRAHPDFDRDPHTGDRHR